MMMSAAGPADVSVDQSTLTGQRSTVKGQVSGHRAPQVSLSTRLTGGPLGSGLGKEKEKGHGLILDRKWCWAGSRPIGSA
jgi:hypothetical protein